MNYCFKLTVMPWKFLALEIKISVLRIASKIPDVSHFSCFQHVSVSVSTLRLYSLYLFYGGYVSYFSHFVTN